MIWRQTIISGAFVAALEYASNATAEVIGKPTKTLFTSVTEELKVAPSDCIMIGDVSIVR